jgi:hypothetical protein
VLLSCSEGSPLQNYYIAYNTLASNDQFQANILHFSSYSQQIQMLKATVQMEQKVLPTLTANQTYNLLGFQNVKAY